MENIFNLPRSFETNYKQFNLPKSSKKILIMSDIHVPFHSMEALTAAIQFGKENNVDTVLLNGDTLDFYRLSRFTVDPLKVDFISEINSAKQFLSSLKESLPEAKIFFKYGNHEERLEIYLKMKAPELWGISNFTLESILGLSEMGIEVIKDKRIIYAGKLPILHGHEIRLGVGTVSAARSLALKTKCSCIVSHLHQTSQHTETRLDGKILSTWSLGCLCELHPEYAPINKWNHGMLLLELDDKGNFNVENYKIINGKLYNS